MKHLPKRLYVMIDHSQEGGMLLCDPVYQNLADDSRSEIGTYQLVGTMKVQKVVHVSESKKVPR